MYDLYDLYESGSARPPSPRDEASGHRRAGQDDAGRARDGGEDGPRSTPGAHPQAQASAYHTPELDWRFLFSFFIFIFSLFSLFSCFSCFSRFRCLTFFVFRLLVKGCLVVCVCVSFVLLLCLFFFFTRFIYYSVDCIRMEYTLFQTALLLSLFFLWTPCPPPEATRLLM